MCVCDDVTSAAGFFASRARSFILYMKSAPRAHAPRSEGGFGCKIRASPFSGAHMPNGRIHPGAEVTGPMIP
jgi:hypothetical protein